VLQKLIEACIEWQRKMILDLDVCLKTRFSNLKPEDSLQQLEMPQAHHIALLDKLIQATRMYATYLLISRIGKI
jgi:hypothetical protein